MLFDSHFHPQLFPLKDLPDLFSKAEAAGVTDLLGVGLNLHDTAELRSIATTFPSLRYSLGLHPLEVNENNYKKILDFPLMNVSALGETGLDYLRGDDRVQMDLQLKSFRHHMDVAASCGLAVIIHTREAEEDTLMVLREYLGKVKGILHCFTGSREMAFKALDMGYYISFSGILTFKNQSALRSIAKDIPLDRILIETDAPYLTPHPIRKISPNAPEYLPYTAACLAEIKGLSTEVISKLLTKNTFECLNI